MSSTNSSDTVDLDPKPVDPHGRVPSTSGGTTVDSAGLSHQGKVRPNNEDHFLVTKFGRFLETLETNLSKEDAPFYEEEIGYGMLVADGIGGHAGGEVASKLAINTLVNLILATPDWILRLDDQSLTKEVMRRAKVRWEQINTALTEEAKIHPNLSGLGTTLTVAWSLGRHLVVAHVGDSRAYLFRNHELRRLTQDHTLAQSLADHGVIDQREVEMHRFRNVLTKALGITDETAEPDLLDLVLEDGDLLLLCSDGLTDMVEESAIVDTLSQDADSRTNCQKLVQQALDSGGKDNVTVLVARYRFAS